MGFRFRKSIKVAPGVKLNFGKNSIGVSAGVKGARVSVNSKGRVTKSVGIPGTGISYVKTSKLGGSLSAPKQNIAYANNIANSSVGNNDVPPYDSNGNSDQNKGKGSKRFLRWLLYFLIVFVATSINANLCYPSFLFAGIIHMFHVRNSIIDEKKRKMSTIRTCCFLVFSILGCFVTLVPSAPDVESITISASRDTMDINDEQIVSITYEPENADTSDMSIKLSNTSLADAELEENGQIALTTLEKEGSFVLTAKSGSVESNELEFQIVDVKKAEEERIAAEKKAEEERIAAEKKAEEERIAAEQKSASAASGNVSEVSYIGNANTLKFHTATCSSVKKMSEKNKVSLPDRETAISRGYSPCGICKP